MFCFILLTFTLKTRSIQNHSTQLTLSAKSFHCIKSQPHQLFLVFCGQHGCIFKRQTCWLTKLSMVYTLFYIANGCEIYFQDSGGKHPLSGDYFHIFPLHIPMSIRFWWKISSSQQKKFGWIIFHISELGCQSIVNYWRQSNDFLYKL